MIIKLETIASVVDDETFMVYPLYQDGHHDTEGGTPLNKCTWLNYSKDEWERNVIEHLQKLQKQRNDN
jgi:hypothetical protein